MSKNIWYTAEPKMESVTEEEFNQFLKDYPRLLSRDVAGMADPPVISYNDFELAEKWPFSVVAQTHAYSNDPDDYYYVPEEERKYKIMSNYQEVFGSKVDPK